MRFLSLLLAILFSSTSLFAQGNSKSSKRTSKKYHVQIQVNYTSFYQGGAERVEKELAQYPLAQTEFFIVKWNGTDKKSEKIQRVKSDENGRIELKLTAGTYGIIGIKDSLELGQYRPLDIHSGSEFESKSSIWEISTNGPIEIWGDTNVMLVNHQRSICYLCP